MELSDIHVLEIIHVVKFMRTKIDFQKHLAIM